jgi:hypothetical protein
MLKKPHTIVSGAMNGYVLQLLNSNSYEGDNGNNDEER